MARNQQDRQSREDKARPAVLYLTRTGLMEPLGQSQVLSYLRGLSESFRICVISLEKPEDLADRPLLKEVRDDCEAYGITWHACRFRQYPRGLAAGWSLVTMAAMALWAVRMGKADLIHARSYPPALVAWLIRRLTGTPFIFDMRALWPEEMITAGRLDRGSFLHRLLCKVERLCLRDADAVVSLTEAARSYLYRTYPEELDARAITVIPTCTDLDRFSAGPPVQGMALYGCIGSVLSGWFRLYWLRAFFEAVKDRDPDARFEIVTRDSPSEVRARLGGDADLQARLSVYGTRSDEMPQALARQTVSVMFYAGGAISELGRSPTRLGEILACGRPVVANEGIGDVSEIIRRHRVGVIAADDSPEAMEEAVSALDLLRQDADLSNRCRRAAEEVFSLERGTRAYEDLYRDLLSKEAGMPAVGSWSKI